MSSSAPTMTSMPGAPPLSRFLAFPWICAIGIALFGVWASVSHVASTAGVVWIAVLSLLMGAGITWAFRSSDRFDVFEPINIVFLFFILNYPLRALAAVWLEEGFATDTPGYAEQALLLILVGFVAFAAGYRLWSSTVHSGRVNRTFVFDERRLDRISMLLLAGTVLTFVLLFILTGTIQYLLIVDPEVRAPGEIKPWFFAFMWTATLVHVAAVLQLGHSFTERRRRLKALFYVAFAAVTSVFVSRLSTICILLMCAAAVHYLKRRLELRALAVLGATFVIYLTAAGLYREWISVPVEATVIADYGGDIPGMVGKYVVGNSDELAMLVEQLKATPHDLPYQWGKTFLPVLLKPIPRSLMPSKPLGAVGLFTSTLMPLQYEAGYSPALSAWSEWYMNFSWPGVVLGMGLLGAACSAAYNLVRRRSGVMTVVVYAVLLIVLLQWLRSDIHVATNYLLFYGAPLGVTAWYSRARSGAALKSTDE